MEDEGGEAHDDGVAENRDVPNQNSQHEQHGATPRIHVRYPKNLLFGRTRIDVGAILSGK